MKQIGDIKKDSAEYQEATREATRLEDERQQAFTELCKQVEGGSLIISFQNIIENEKTSLSADVEQGGIIINAAQALAMIRRSGLHLHFEALEGNADALKATMVSTKYPVNFLTPIDKVTLRAFENKLTGRQMQKVGMERRGSKKQINTLASINFDNFNGSVQIKGRKELTAYDREVHDAIITLFVDGGNEYMTPQMIYQVMTGNPDAYLNPKQAEAISESITKCMYSRLIIDASEEAKEYGFDSFKYDGNLISGERVTATLNGTVVECLRLLRTPVLYEYANKKNHIGRFDIKLLNSPIKKTEEIITLQGYLYRRILSMKGKKSNLSKTIVYDTVYNQIEVTATSRGALRKKKSKVRDQVKKILDYWKQENFIAGYVENKRGTTIYSVTIRL